GPDAGERGVVAGPVFRRHNRIAARYLWIAERPPVAEHAEALPGGKRGRNEQSDEENGGPEHGVLLHRGVGDGDDFPLLFAAGKTHGPEVAHGRAAQGAGEGGAAADLAAGRMLLVVAEQGDGALPGL